VWSWGSNNRGQLGLGPDAVTGSVYSATQIPGLAGIRKISAGETHALALATDGTVYAWGLGDFCRLGTGDSATRNAPVAVATGVSDIDAGEFSSIFNIGGAIWRAGRTPGLNGDACALQPTLLGGS
jgi:alpha-tubulin suppressor-like RCC1 family protein